MASSNDKAPGKKVSTGRSSGGSQAPPDRSRKPVAKKAERRSRLSSSRDRRTVLLPLLAVWLLAIVVLSGLIYWSESSIDRSTKPSKYARTAVEPQQSNKPVSGPEQVESLSKTRNHEPPPGAGVWKRPGPREKDLALPETGKDPIRADQSRSQAASSEAHSPVVPTRTERDSQPPASSAARNGDHAPVPQPERRSQSSAAAPDKNAEQPPASQPDQPVRSPNASLNRDIDRSHDLHSDRNAPTSATSAAQNGVRALPPEPDRHERESTARVSRDLERASASQPEEHAQPQAASAEKNVERAAHAPQAEQNSQMAIASVSKNIERAPIPKAERSPALDASLAKVAIVIDDFGKSMEVARKFLTIPLPLTFSVLPFEAHSKEVAELAHSHRREVLLHAPMEPKGYPKVNPGQGALLLSMSDDAVRKAFRTALDFSPHVSGVNNHMGSSFTEKSERMKIVLSEIHNRGLYFLDSYTSPNSTGFMVAQRLNMPHMRRDVFLDHTVSEKFVLSQIKTLIRQAKIHGVAVAIGHPHEVTYKALMKEAETFKREGVAVVSAGELAKENAAGFR